jgi:hypothetical protein
MDLPVVFEVVSPSGKSSQISQTLAPGLSTLEGKTICELWNRDFRGEIVFPKIRELLRKQYPSINIINYDEIVTPDFCTMGQRPEDAETLKILDEILIKKGCDAVISGIGN